MPFRVMYVIDSLVAGGAERSLATLAPRYAALDIQLEVAYLHERVGVQRDLLDAGATLWPLASSSRVGWPLDLLGIIRRRRPDLVHTTLFEADQAGRVAAALARVPVVSSIVNLSYGSGHVASPSLRRWKLEAARLVDASTARLARRFHAVTRSVAEQSSSALGIAPDRIEIIPRGREPRALGTPSARRRDAARVALEVARDVPLLVAVARQEHQKGLDLLLEAFEDVRRAVPHAVLLLVGREGSATPALRDAVSPFGPAVRFMGERSDVADVLCAADVFVLPSRWEGMPGALLEAMALEVPSVATSIPPVLEMVDGTNVILTTPVDDVPALAHAVIETLLDRAAAVARARSARQLFFEKYTVERTAKAMLGFYQRALEIGTK